MKTFIFEFYHQTRTREVLSVEAKDLKSAFVDFENRVSDYTGVEIERVDGELIEPGSKYSGFKRLKDKLSSSNTEVVLSEYSKLYTRLYEVEKCLREVRKNAGHKLSWAMIEHVDRTLSENVMEK